MQEISRKNGDMEIREVKAKKGHYFTNTVTLTIDTDKGTHRITGSLFDRKEAKIVSLDHFRVDFEPKGCIILAPHENKPGMDRPDGRYSRQGRT